MTYTEFAKKMTYAMFEEERHGASEVDIDKLQNKYGIDGPQHWVTDWLESSGHIRFTAKDSGHGTTLRMGSINGHGRSWVENNAGDLKLAAGLVRPVEASGAYEQTIVSQTALNPSPYDSSIWTGVETRTQADNSIVVQVSERIDEIDRLVEAAGLNNSQTARAKAITQSLKLLISSPQPEWRAIVALLNSPFLMAMVNVLAVTQFTLKLVFGIG